jgi:hypothetical protein
MRAVRQITCLLVRGLLVCGWLEVQAKTRRALLVGIDLYQPTAATGPSRRGESTVEARGVADPPTSRTLRGSWNLNGAVNEVEAVQAILVARYGVRPEHITNLPAMTLPEALEITRISRVAGLTGAPWPGDRPPLPGAAPHHLRCRADRRGPGADAGGRVAGAPRCALPG